jgi:hypothetical protein
VRSRYDTDGGRRVARPRIVDGTSLYSLMSFASFGLCSHTGEELFECGAHVVDGGRSRVKLHTVRVPCQYATMSSPKPETSRRLAVGIRPSRSSTASVSVGHQER